MKKSLSVIYDIFANTYDQNRGLFDMSEVFWSFFNRLNVEKGNLLDLGCGSGESFSKLFIDQGWNATGVDFSEKMLEMASKYVPEMETICADMREVDFPSEKFDVITAIYSLFHLPQKDHPTLFSNFYKWLRPGGKAFFTYATKEYTEYDEFEGHRTFLGQELFYSHTTPEKLYSILEGFGFIIEASDYREIGGEVFLWITVKKNSPAKHANKR